MNILELQDDLQGMSVAFLEEKADGEDSNYPAWLVNAVLNQKFDARKKADLAAGAAGKGQPSVSAQLKQKAGLMALQNMQRGLAESNMGAQMATTPQAVPADVVQPEKQAQPSGEPVMGAHGGLARLPMDPRMFDYGDGGIVAFAKGSDEPVGSEDKPKKSFLDTLLEGLSRNKLPGGNIEKARQKIQELQAAQAAQEGPPPRSTKESIYGSAPSRTLPLAAPVAATQPPVVKTQPPVEESAGAALMRAPPRPADPATVAQQQTSPAAPVAPKPRPAPQQLPANPNTSATQAAGLPTLSTNPELKNQLSAALAEPAYVQRTPQQILADEAFFTPESLKSPAGMAELKRLDDINTQYESRKGGRGMGAINAGLEALMRGGNYGSGAANQRLAYEAADVTQADARNKALTAIETVQRAEDTAKRTRGLASLDSEIGRGIESKKDRRKDLTAAYGDFQRAATSEYSSNTELAKQTLANMGSKQVAEIHARSAAATANRPGEQERIIAKYLDLYAKDPKAAEFYMQTVERAKLGGNEARKPPSPKEKSAGIAIPGQQRILREAQATASAYAGRKADDPAKKSADAAVVQAQAQLDQYMLDAGGGEPSDTAPKPKPDPTGKPAPIKWNAVK